MKLRRTITALLALALAGCAAASGGEKEMKRDLVCTAEVTGDAQYTAELERADNAGWRVTLIKPESAEGMELSYLADGNCSLRLQGHTVVYSRNDIPDTGIFDLITAAADMCINGKGVTSEPSSEGVTLHGEIRGIGFSAECSDGSIRTMQLGSSFNVQFRDTPALDSEQPQK